MVLTVAQHRWYRPTLHCRTALPAKHDDISKKHERAVFLVGVHNLIEKKIHS